MDSVETSNSHMRLFYAVVVLIFVAHIVPVPDYFIEFQPDGQKSLGRIPAEAIRIIGIVFACIPFAVLALATNGLRRIKTSPGLCLGIALTVSFLGNYILA